MNFEFKPAGVDESKPLLYMWQITDDEGLIVYRYVGKAQGGSARPLKHYRRNVDNYIAGKPYRKSKPDQWRAVHKWLIWAVLTERPITLFLIRNVLEGENIYTAEAIASETYCGKPFLPFPPVE
ncbi:hypothetical protein ACIQYQ_09840 [Pseudomonas asiatica]|uniref:hypothetical protein n=1 Tax=Pseudomonas asiatica TaxID=2219225 RepID=UPI00383B35BA